MILFISVVLLGTVNDSWLYQCRVEYKTGVQSVSQKLYATLTGIQTGRIDDKMGWTVEVDWTLILKYSLCWKLVGLHTLTNTWVDLHSFVIVFSHLMLHANPSVHSLMWRWKSSLMWNIHINPSKIQWCIRE